MSDETNKHGKLWGIAAVVGVLAFLALKLIASYSFWPALLLAILIAILVAILLWIGFYRDDDVDVPASAAPKPAAKAASSTAATSTQTVTQPAKSAAKPKSTAAKAKPKAKTSDKAKASAMMGDAGTAMVSKKKAAKAAPKTKPVAKNGKPPVLKKARAAGADDLKVIKGVGPGLEKTLNELGFFHYDQIAGWRKKEIEWVDERLKFKGRIVRDDWVKQCKSLAKKK